MSWCRHPHTTQEMRAAAGSPNFIRRKRSIRLLPSNFDDMPKRNNRIRSWKRHRPNQWKENQ